MCSEGTGMWRTRQRCVQRSGLRSSERPQLYWRLHLSLPRGLSLSLSLSLSHTHTHTHTHIHVYIYFRLSIAGIRSIISETLSCSHAYFDSIVFAIAHFHLVLSFELF